MSANGRIPDERFAEAVSGFLAERGRTTNGDIRAVLEGIEALPDRASSGGRPWLAAVAAIALLVGGGLALGRLSLPGLGGPPVGRDAFRTDPRLAQCEAVTGRADQVFEMTHAEWFPLYFPGWYRGAPELEVGDPALVVIGAPQELGVIGGRPMTEPSVPQPTQHPWVQMCVAVGVGADAAAHQYGPTWFDRIVPVLSDAEVARAAHLDPDVLADPAAWAFPERLAPCGGLTGNEQYIFEARLNQLAYIFPGLTNATFGDDDPVVVVVYRATASDAVHHDVCLASEVAGAQPDHRILPGVDLTGFHLRIDREITDPPIVAPGPTVIPSEPDGSPPPDPAWIGDATVALRCDGIPKAEGSLGMAVSYQSTPEDLLVAAIQEIRRSGLPLPVEGWSYSDGADGAVLYTYDVAGRPRAAIAAQLLGANDGLWRVASAAACDTAEFDPATPVGAGQRWTTVDGDPTSDVVERPDCYGATTIQVRGRLFLRDPEGSVDQGQLDASYAASTVLPKDALWLGYVAGPRALWTAVDGSALFVVDSNDTAHAERLPHVKGEQIQRIDCN